MDMPGPRTSPRRLRVLAGLVGAVFLAGCQLPSVAGQLPPDTTDYPAQPPTDTLTGPVPVTRVVDGDTLWVNTEGGDTKVRLIGVDTPELLDPRSPVQCFAQEASDFTKSALTGQVVYLEYDPSQDSVDRYGRLLAYVWTLDGRLVNLESPHELVHNFNPRYQWEVAEEPLDSLAESFDEVHWGDAGHLEPL